MFNPNSLKKKSKGTSTGAGYTGLKIALQDNLIIIPSVDEDNKAVISNDFVFDANENWIPVFSENEKIKITEEAQDGKNNAYTSKIEGFYPGDDENIRSLVNDEGIGEANAYIMVSHCEEHKSYVLGKGECCPATIKISFDSGDDGNPRGWTFTAEAKQNGVMAEYRGVGSSTKRFFVDDRDTTPDLSRGAGTYVLPENTSTNIGIGGFDNGLAGNIYVLEWSSTTNHSKIMTGGPFVLAGDFTPIKGAKLYLHCLTPRKFVERSRYIPS